MNLLLLKKMRNRLREDTKRFKINFIGINKDTLQ